jgi:quaternary ammonium compound-resistance protein SugE
MAWLYLIAAGVAELGFTTALRYVEGFTRLWPTLIFVAFAVLSLWLFEKASQTIPLGVAYAVWVAIGAAGTVILGMTVFREPVNVWQLLFIATLLGSIAGLKAVTP